MKVRSALLVFVFVAPLLYTPVDAKVVETARPDINFNLRAPAIASLCSRAQQTADRGITGVVAIPTSRRTFTNTVQVVEDIQTRFGETVASAVFLKDVSPDPKVRKASLECTNSVSNYRIRLGSRVDLYRAYRAVAQGEKLDAPGAKLLDTFLNNARRSGTDLPEAKRAELTRLRERLSKLQDDFSANLSNNTDSIELTRAELEGLPEDFTARLKQTDKGYILTMKVSDYMPFMENAVNAQARRKVETKYQNREAAKNVALLEEAIALRQRIAGMLGYSNHSAYVLADQMAGSPERVEAFLKDLNDRLKVKTQKELQVLLTLKQKDDPTATAIEGWDWRYYANQLKKTQYAVDNEQVRAYFPVDHVITSVFDLYQGLLGVKFEEVEPANAWSPEVRLFAIRDGANNALIGHFYADLYPREGKYGHFAAFDLGVGHANLDGTYRNTFAAMVGNWPRGAADKPALLSHEDVETFFHEFGHIMHQTLTRAKYASLAGTNVRRDFVEAPSQMLENWVWDPAILKRVSKHYQTGEPLPDALLDKMVAAKHVNEGIHTSRQLMFATVDYRYHSSGSKVDTTTTWNELSQSVMQVPSVPGTHPQAAFGHLMGGYDSGYYGYLWSKVFAQDMFTRFEKEGLTSSKVGAEYRKQILEPGGVAEPDVLIRNFLGREPSKEAFYRELGL